MRHLLFALALLLAAVAPVTAQTLIGPLPITADEQCVSVQLGDAASASIQIFGTWTGTITFQSSTDGGVYEDMLMVNDTTGSADTSTTVSGIFAKSNTGVGWIRACATDTITGTANVTITRGFAGGGGSGGGGSSGGAVEITDGVDDALVSAGGELLVSCADCSGSGVSSIDDAAFTLATDDAVPIAGVFATDSVTAGDSGAIRMSANRNLFVNVRDAAGNERGLNIDANGAIAAVVSDGTGALNVIIDSSAALTVGDGAGALNVIVDSGTITANAGTDLNTSLLALESGGNLATIAGDTTAIEVAVESALTPVAPGAASATAGVLAGGQYNLTPPTFTDGQQGSLQLSSSGALLVSGGGGGTEYVVNAAAPTNPTGNAPVAERDDALSALSEVEGDWTNLRSDANGALWVINSGSVTVTDGSGALNVIVDSGTVTTVSTVTAVTSLTGLGGVAVPVEDAAETAAGTGIYAMTVRRDTAASSAGTTGDNATLNTDATGRVWTTGTVLEDVASAAADQLMAVAGIRDDTLDARSGTEGDYEMLHMNVNGALWVIDVNSAAALTSTQLIDDMIGVEDAAETAGTGLAMVGSVRRDTAASSANTTGDNASINTDSLGRLWVTGSAVEDAAETGGGLLNMVGTVRRDTADSSAGSTGDNATLNTDATGNLWVNPFSQTQNAATYLTVRISDGSSFANLATDATYDGTASTTGPQLMGIFDDVSVDSVDEGDAGHLRMSAARVLYSTLRDAAGNERGANVNASNELLVSCSTCSGSGVSQVDDDPFTVASSDGVPTMGTYIAAGDSVQDGDAGAVRMSANRGLFVNIRDNAGNERGLNIDASGQLAATIASFPDNEPFDVARWAGSAATGGAGAVAAGTPRVTLASDDPLVADIATITHAEDAAHSTTQVGVMALAVRQDSQVDFGADGDYTPLSIDADGGLRVSVLGTVTVGSHAVTNAGTFAVQSVEGAGSLLTSSQLIDDTIFADEAAFTYTTSKVSVAGGVAESTTDAVADGVAASLRLDLARLLMVRNLDPCSGVAKNYFVVDIADGTNTEIANAVASEFFYICSVNLVAGAATTVLISEDDTDGCSSPSAGLTGGSTGTTAEGWSFAANGGIALGAGNAAVLKTGTANRYLCIDQSATTQLSGTISYVSAP